MARYKFLVIFVVAAVLMLVVLFTSGDGFFHRRKAPESDKRDSYTRLRIQRFEESMVAPDFTLKDIKGNQVALKDFKGRIVFLNFWATWCPPCRVEMPSMERLYQQLRGKGLVMLAVDMQESENLVKAFINDFKLSFPALLDRDGDISFLYGVRGLPTTYIIDHEGQIIGKAVGPRDWASQDALKLFQSLLKKTASVAS
ncbi:MAG: TlpA disulfide reductase family protein [Candidatus Binatia bacterium]